MEKSNSIIKNFNVNVKGNGQQPMMFAHGYGCDQSMWRYLEPTFSNRFRSILFDLVGCGKSNSSCFDQQKHSTLSGYADDVLSICDSLNLKDIVFVGHSVSAVIGILAAIKEPQRFSKLILIGPSPCYFNDGDYIGGFEKETLVGMLENLNADFLGWSRAMGPAIMGRPDRPELGVELTNSFCQTDPTIAKHFAKTVFLSDNRADLKKIKTPSLILQCSQDIIAPDSVGRYMHQEISGSRLKTLKAIGHCPHVSEPQETITAMNEFLEPQIGKKTA